MDDGTSSPKDKGSNEVSSSRWWEFYAVRYAMGTVVGAVVFYFLCCSTPVLRPLVFGAGPADANAVPVVPVKLDTVQLALLVAYGLVYCYIASAPILVFHATRFLLNFDVGYRIWCRRLLCYGAPPLVAGCIVYFKTRGLGLFERLFFPATSFLFILIVWLEYCVVLLTLLNGKRLYEFYERLADRRQEAKGGITDSYKHLSPLYS
jgi:hypothetical protein